MSSRDKKEDSSRRERYRDDEDRYRDDSRERYRDHKKDRYKEELSKKEKPKDEPYKKEDKEERKRRRRSRWEADEKQKVIIPGLPTYIPSNLTAEQEKIYLLQVQIEAISRRLRTGDLGIPDNPKDRSPSPEPIYNSNGARINTREVLKRQRMEGERHRMIQEMLKLNKVYVPPPDYKPVQPKFEEKIIIPQEEHPDINFIGLIIGPRGNTLKAMEKETNTKIMIRGKGSVREDRPHESNFTNNNDEPLHACITGPNPEAVQRAVRKLNEVIKKGIECPEEMRRKQLRELAIINGTLIQNSNNLCNNCGSTFHKSWECPDKLNVTNNILCTNCNAYGHIAKDCKQPLMSYAGDNKNLDEEYLSLMSELGEEVKHVPKKLGFSAPASGGGGPMLSLPAPPAPDGPLPNAEKMAPSYNGNVQKDFNSGYNNPNKVLPPPSAQVPPPLAVPAQNAPNPEMASQLVYYPYQFYQPTMPPANTYPFQGYPSFGPPGMGMWPPAAPPTSAPPPPPPGVTNYQPQPNPPPPPGVTNYAPPPMPLNKNIPPPSGQPGYKNQGPPPPPGMPGFGGMPPMPPHGGQNYAPPPPHGMHNFTPQSPPPPPPGHPMPPPPPPSS